MYKTMIEEPWMNDKPVENPRVYKFSEDILTADELHDLNRAAKFNRFYDEKVVLRRALFRAIESDQKDMIVIIEDMISYLSERYDYTEGFWQNRV